MWFPLFAQKRRAASAPARRPSFRPRLEALEDRCVPSAGALDPTFGAGAGYVTTSLSNSSSDQARQVLVQPSGRIVVAGQTIVTVTTTTKKGTTTATYNALGVATYNPDGSLDTAFGSGGIVRTLFSGSSGSGLSTAALEPTGATGDDKILLAGTEQNQTGMALMRLNADGSLDASFGNNGQVLTYFPESVNHSENPGAVAVTSSGQIQMVGEEAATGTVLLARYNPNGSLDPTFGSNGTVTTVFPTITVAHAIALQPDGKFLVAGHQHGRGLLLRYNADGSLDTTFGNGGVVTTVVPLGSTTKTNFVGMTLYPLAGTANDRKIIVAGTSTLQNSLGQTVENEWVAARYNPNGALDPTFGGGAGYVVVSDPKFAYPDDNASALALESDGKPILVGSASALSSSSTYSQVARLNVDGSPDATFGSGGLVATAIGYTGAGPNGSFNAVAIQPDGNILAAGGARFVINGAGVQDFSLARYLPSEPQIGSFTASPNPATAGYSTTLTASNITDGNAGSTITQVTFYYIDGAGAKQVLGYGTQTSPGVWTLTFTVNLASGSYTLYAQAQDTYGALGDPFALSLQVN